MDGLDFWSSAGWTELRRRFKHRGAAECPASGLKPSNQRSDIMSLQDQIKKDLAAAMKAKDEERKNALRVIMGEFGRQEGKQLDDELVIQIVKKLVKSEKEVLERSGGGDTNRFIDVCEAYLPRMAGEDEIKAWIGENIDLSQFKNKMQAMRPIMQHFGANADGNLVKKILSQL
jgi:hypothetical protein